MKNYKLNENSEYWNKYYNNKKEILPNSSFSKFTLPYLQPRLSLIDIGCGDGRDSLFFAKNNIETLGVDFSKVTTSKNKEYENDNLKFKRLNLMKINDITQNFNYAYCRFMLHAINYEIQEQIFDWMFKNILNKIFIETRIADAQVDSQKYNHFRRDFTRNEVLKSLEKHNFKIIYSKVSRNFSKYKKAYSVNDLNHNPLLLRIVIQK
jgi:SAM-dependent methyltransferase